MALPGMTLTNIRPLSPSKLQDTRRWLRQIMKSQRPALMYGSNVASDNSPFPSHIVVRELTRGKP